MVNANANRITASKLIRRALQIADLSNTDFLNYEELTEYLNSAFKNVYQNIINYNLNVFTAEANLVNANGVYRLPFDCYQLKSVKNPITGRLIPRKSDSEGMFSDAYEIVNDTIVIGPNSGPIVITYWRKPYFLSFPNRTINTSYDGQEVIDVCKNSILYKEDENYVIYNLLTDNKKTVDLSNLRYLGNNFLIDDNWNFYDFNGNTLFTSESEPDYLIRSDNGMIYFGKIEDDKINVYAPGNSTVVDSIDYDESIRNIVCINDEFIITDEDVFPLGLFDSRPAYIKGTSLFLINDDNTVIEEKMNVPSIGTIINTSYGFLTFDGKLYSNVPDTILDFPHNLYYDVLSYELAIRFLCKQNADSSGVDALNLNAWNQLTSAIDQNADFQRIKLVRR